MSKHSIFCLNTHLFKGTFVAAVYRKLQYNDKIRCDQICEYILQSSYTTVILSEVWSRYMRNRIIRKLSPIYPYHHVPIRRGPCYKVGPEHIILSKKPITEFCSENITDLSSWDQMSIKQICGFVIDNDYICTSHFDTGHMLKNTVQLKNFIQKYSGNRNTILVGDLNIWEVSQNAPTVQTDNYNQMCHIFAEVGLRDALRQIHPDFVSHPFHTVDQENNPVSNYFSDGGTNKTHIDYFFTKGIEPTNIDVIVSLLSDHYGITMSY